VTFPDTRQLAVVEQYPVVIEPLPKEEGGGFVATVPDLPGCVSDGETREAAARNIADAIRSWIDEATILGRTIPAPSAHLAMAGE